MALEEQNHILDIMLKTIHSLRKVGSKKVLPFQKGIINSIKSLKLLFKGFRFQYKVFAYKSVKSRSFGRFFSIIRQIGGLYDHPTALQFKYRLRNYVMGRKDDIISEASNVEQEANDVPNIAIMNVHYLENEKDTAEVVTGKMFGILEVPEHDTYFNSDQHTDLTELQ